jgi:hypothetical protein
MFDAIHYHIAQYPSEDSRAGLRASGFGLRASGFGLRANLRADISFFSPFRSP